jgi:hypothetical protein
MDHFTKNILNRNLVDATLQGNLTLIEKLIDLGASISNPYSLEQEKDAIFMAIFQKDLSLLEFIFNCAKKHNIMPACHDEPNYVNVLHYNDDIRFLKLMQKELYISEDNYYNSSNIYLAPNILEYYFQNNTQISDNVYKHLEDIIQCSMGLYQINEPKMYGSKFWTPESHYQVLKIFHQYQPNLINNLISFSVKSMIVNSSLINEQNRDNLSSNLIFLANLTDFGLDVKKQLKEYTPKPQTHQKESWSIESWSIENLRNIPKEEQNTCFIDLFDDENIKIQLEKMILERKINSNQTKKSIKI